MRCGGCSAVGVDGGDVGVFPLRCKRWSCPTCGPRKARQTMVRVRRGMSLGTCRFFTITSPGGDDAETTYREFPGRWKRLHQRLERRFGRIEYLGVVEPQPKRGAAHIHVVYRGPFIPQAVLSRLAEASGFGRIVDIRRSNPRLITYLAKYLTKQLSSGDRPGAAAASTVPKYFRRVRVSRAWCEWTRQRDVRWPHWLFTNAGPLMTAISAAQRGYRVVELQADTWDPPDNPHHRVEWLSEIPRRIPDLFPSLARRNGHAAA